MKIKVLWACIAVAVALVLGFIGGVFTRPGTKPVNVTNTVYGTNIIYFHDFADATNLDNYPQVFADYTNYSSAPFRFIQNNDTLQVTLWKRSASVKIKSWQKADGLIAGGGWNLTGYPVVLMGYHFGPLTALLSIGITTNLNLSLMGAWMF